MRRPVPEGAYRFARDRLWLARGLKPFVRDLLVPGQCSCWTLADRAVGDERLAQFDVGGFVAPDDVAELVASEVAPILAGSEDRVLLVPDPVASPGDAFLKQETMRHVVVGGGVYYVEGSAETERLVTSWRAGASAAGQMAIVSSVGHELTRDELDLQRAADASVVLVFEAYDGYGALFFTRHGEAFRLPD